MGLLLVPELAPAILAQVAFLPAVRALDRPTISRLLLLIHFFPTRAPPRFPWLLTAFTAGGPVALEPALPPRIGPHGPSPCSWACSSGLFPHSLSIGIARHQSTPSFDHFLFHACAPEISMTSYRLCHWRTGCSLWSCRGASELQDFHDFLPPLPLEEPLLLPELLRSFRHASHFSSVRSRRPCLSTAEATFFFRCSILHSLSITSSTIRSFTSSNISIEIATCSIEIAASSSRFLSRWFSHREWWCCWRAPWSALKNHRRISRP